MRLRISFVLELVVREIIQGKDRLLTGLSGVGIYTWICWLSLSSRFVASSSVSSLQASLLHFLSFVSPSALAMATFFLPSPPPAEAQPNILFFPLQSLLSSRSACRTLAKAWLLLRQQSASLSPKPRHAFSSVAFWLSQRLRAYYAGGENRL